MRSRFIKKYRLYLFLALWVAAYPLFLELTGIGCPIRYVFGVQCPGCGMTRALLCALRLDFASAFAFHPAWFVPPAAAVLAAAFGIAEKNRAQSVVLSAAVLLLIAAHVWRTFF